MIVAIVTFRLPRPWTVEEATETFNSKAPKYLNKPGLVRKHYYVTEAGDGAGGIYLWRSKADAQACHMAEWENMMTDKYGAAPEITYMHVPVTIDNEKHLIEEATNRHYLIASA